MTADQPVRGILRWASLLHHGLHLALLVMSPMLVATGGLRRHTAAEIGFATVAGVALAAVHLRHVRAAARGERPAAWPLTLALQVLLVYAPSQWLGQDWGSTAIPLSASMMLLLPRRWGPAVGFTAPFLVTGTEYGMLMFQILPVHGAVWQLVYFTITWSVYVPMLYGTARLVRLVNELYRSRAELAENAVGEERMRVSRDLHDLLGQSLSAISLKGDLAARLLPMDPSRARHEITSVAELARSTLRDVRAVTRDEHQVTLREELAAARSLLAAAGVDTRVDTGGAGHELSAGAQRVLAWAVREGITNLLRHSEATTCTITLTRIGGLTSLDIRNDGVRRPLLSDGTGLTGLKDRAASAGGSASGRTTGNDEFHLHVELPDTGAMAERP